MLTNQLWPFTRSRERPCSERAQPRQRLILGVATVAFLVITVHSAGAQSPAGQSPPSQSPTGQTPYYLGPPELDAGWTPGEAPYSMQEEMQDIYTPDQGHLHLGPVEKPLGFLASQADALAEKTGLRLAVAYTMPIQQASGGPGDRYGGAGRLQLMSSWTLLGRGTKNTGQLVISGENNFAIGSQPPSRLRSQIGALIGTVTGFNDQGWILGNLYWTQRLFDGRLRFLIGRADSAEFVGSHWLETASNAFMNRHFSDNPTMSGPLHGPSAGISYVPNKSFYATAGTSDSYGESTRISLDTLSEGAFFTFGEVGYTPTIDGHGQGRYCIAPWYMAARSRDHLPSDSGVTVVADQELSSRLQFFARYGYAEATLTNVQQLAQGGIGFRGSFGNPDDFSGVAFSVAIPKDRTLRSEKVLEAFYRWQVTAHSRFSVGVQGIFDPSLAPRANAIGVYYIRLRTAF
jgi:porin